MVNEKCCVCGKELVYFIGYIPNKGECCLDCFNRYMIEDDNNKTLPQHPPGGF